MQNRKDFSMEINFTKTYQQYKNEHLAILEANCIKAQYPHILCDIGDSDLFAGKVSYGAIGFSKQDAGFMYFINDWELNGELQKKDIDEGYRSQLEEMIAFWRKENTQLKTREAYPPEMAKALPSDNWTGEPGVAFPLYRMGGPHINFQKLMQLGIPGMFEMVENFRLKALSVGGDAKLFEAMRMALDLIVDAAHYYSNQAEKMAASVSDAVRERELSEMSSILRKITVTKPETLREAMQLAWLYAIISEVRNYGRMDIYLGDFYSKDIDSGLISEAEAQYMVDGLWRMMVDRGTTFDGRVIIGGLGRPNDKNADRFAMAAMEASRVVKETLPQLSLRFYKGMNPALMEKALAVLGEGRTYPILYNDDINVGAVEKAFDVTGKEAEQYMPFGCGEYILNHMSFGTPSGVINLLKALEITLHNGRDPITGKMMGLQTGEFKDFKTFDNLFSAYRKQAEYFIDALADQEELEYRIAGENAAFLYLTMLYDDCMQRGKAIFSGGIKYLGGTLETYGNTNTADSLTAIKYLVYDKKLLTQEEMLKALDADFKGFEKEQLLAREAPKYGNDNEYADTVAIEVHNHVCNAIRNQRNRTGLHSYLAVIINNQANTIMGKWTAASADGRFAGQPMANANNPSGGSDKNGVTAFLNSIVKLDPSIHAGAVQNMKFSKGMFTISKAKLEALLDTYFGNGGTQAMITVLNRDDLEKALVEPGKYQDLIVRVGGFSARFVELDKSVQREVLSRTLY